MWHSTRFSVRVRRTNECLSRASPRMRWWSSARHHFKWTWHANRIQHIPVRQSVPSYTVIIFARLWNANSGTRNFLTFKHRKIVLCSYFQTLFCRYYKLSFPISFCRRLCSWMQTRSCTHANRTTVNLRWAPLRVHQVNWRAPDILYHRKRFVATIFKGVVMRSYGFHLSNIILLWISRCLRHPPNVHHSFEYGTVNYDLSTNQVIEQNKQLIFNYYNSRREKDHKF